MKIVAIANQKGGVGKTTTAVALAHGAALRGKRVLLIDLDTQGNCADSLGLEDGGDLSDWLMIGKPLWQCVILARENLDLMRSNKSTAGLKMMLSTMDFREKVLSRILRPHRGYVPPFDYDLIFIDCAPSVDVLHTAALVTADALIIPTRMDQFAIKGVLEMIRSLESVQQATDCDCRVIGILPTFFDRVTNESHAQLKHLASAFNGLVWAPIPQDAKLREGSRLGKTVWEMEKSRALEGYKLAMEKLL